MEPTGLVADSRPMTDASDTARLRRKALLIHDRLCEAYGCPVAYFHHLDPLSELISSTLSHRTRNRDSGNAFKALRARYADWAEMRDAPTEEVERLIQGVTWPEQKAPRLQRILREITERRGTLDLDFLVDMPVPEARAWLEGLTGIGPKTSAAVLSFSRLRLPALPVDSHHHRVAQRTGLIGKSVAVGPSHAILEKLIPADWDAQQVYDHHEVLMFHGQRCCHYRSPDCGRCVLLDLCPEGRTRLPDAAGPAGAQDRPPGGRDRMRPGKEA
jgi:endonuclease-3